MWIFGYGSLIWKQGFPVVAQRVGHVQGWTRRFYQGSPDHRGVPEAPGRVVTLLEAPDEHTTGVAFQVAPEAIEETLERLDVREQGGYTRFDLPFFTEPAAAPIEVITYIALPDNPHYLGADTLDAMAQQIATSSGPSGPNSEYLTKLAEALRTLQIEDEHVFALEEHLRRFIS